MSYGSIAATVLQTALISAFILVLTPLRVSVKKALMTLGGLGLVLCLVSSLLAWQYGTMLLYRYGFGMIGLPVFLGLALLSSAKGFRFIFVALTAFLFHQIILTLLMTFRVYEGGFTLLYFVLNLLLFGALICGGWRVRVDFHKIVFTYKTEFCCLCPILLLLFMLIRVFSPIVGQNQIDYDLLVLSLALYLLIVLLYIYIAVGFHSLSRRCDAERDAVSLRLGIAEAQEHIAMLRSFQEAAATQRHDLRHHMALIEEFLEEGQTDRLREYIAEAKKDLDKITPPRYCQNETANLLLNAFAAKAVSSGVTLHCDARFPSTLPIGSTELCALLSNALENAIAAACLTPQKERSVRMTGEIADGKLLILVENPYSGTVRMENGLPKASLAGHGFGVKSITAIVDKHNGLYSFEAVNGIFTLRIAI